MSDQDGLKAGVVLDDCCHALHLLEMESDPKTFRVLWVAAVALVRSVGHVLEKVDAVKDERLKQIISRAYARWKADKEQNSIFWEFIRDERNQLLKEYVISFSSDPVPVRLGDVSYKIGNLLFCPIIKGKYSGADCRDILSDAIDWWEKELNQIADEYLND
jgi:hypothetical protein